MLPIPIFPYHPDPFASKVVVAANEICECCEQRRTLFYVGPFYAVQEIEKICLWCVADGSAAEKFDGMFVDDMNFDGQNMPKKIVDQITRRTPSYSAWQQEQWLTHCGDACEFHGFPSADELKAAPESTRMHCDPVNESEQAWNSAIENFEAGDAGFYKFKCHHCDQVQYAFDCS